MLQFDRRLEKKTRRIVRERHSVSIISQRDQAASVSSVALGFPRFQVSFQLGLTCRMAAAVIGQQHFLSERYLPSLAREAKQKVAFISAYKSELIDWKLVRSEISVNRKSFFKVKVSQTTDRICLIGQF